MLIITIILMNKLPKCTNFFLLYLGSPCNQVSKVNATRKRFLPGSSANLLFEYVRLRDTLEDICRDEGRSFYYLFENTSNMDAECLSVFTK